jgi:hypothetical protein
MPAHGRGEVVWQIESSAASNGVQSVSGGDCGDGQGTHWFDYRRALIIRTRTLIVYGILLAIPVTDLSINITCTRREIHLHR